MQRSAVYTSTFKIGRALAKLATSGAAVSPGARTAAAAPTVEPDPAAGLAEEAAARDRARGISKPSTPAAPRPVGTPAAPAPRNVPAVPSSPMGRGQAQTAPAYKPPTQQSFNELSNSFQRLTGASSSPFSYNNGQVSFNPMGGLLNLPDHVKQQFGVAGPTGQAAPQQQSQQQLPQSLQDFAGTGQTGFNPVDVNTNSQQQPQQTFLGGLADFGLNAFTPYGLVNPENWKQGPSLGGLASNPLGMAGMYGASAAAPGLGWIANKVAPQAAARFGSSALGQFAQTPGALSNAWAATQQAAPWLRPALQKIPLAGRMFPGAAAAPANAFAGLTGTSGAAGAAGTAGTAGLALYGAYALGDLPYSAYQVANDPKLLERRSQDQVQAWRNDGGWSGYWQNVGGNLARPGLAAMDFIRSGAEGAYNTGRNLRRGFDDMMGANSQQQAFKNDVYAKELANYDREIAAAQSAGDSQRVAAMEQAKANTLKAQGKNNSVFRWWYGH